MAVSPSNPLRIGIVGLGYIGSFVGGQFHRHPDASVEAVCDLDAERRQHIGGRFDVDDTNQYDDYGDMLEASTLDAVLIGTPHTLHADQVSRALDHGLHVYCDKPLTTDTEDAKQLLERVETSEELVMVGYQRHLQTAFKQARARYHTSALEPQWVTASITQPWIDDSVETWRLEPALSGGGFLSDTGSHVLDGVLWTTGLVPEAVRASMDFHDEAAEIDRRAHLDVRFSNGATGNFSFHGDASAVREHIHIWDDEGAVYLEGKEWRSRRVYEIDTDSSEHHPYIDHRAEPDRAAAFLESVREGTEPPATVADGLAVAALTDAAYESARRDEWVQVDY